ncbi:MAG TPA: hypothetical protein VJ063_16050 [Verrucomicrobiae bacterium]|nr:hypothetical protein [Verrucomicrobiae bacterium]
MSDELDACEVEALKSRFRAAGCRVTDIDGKSFEIVGSDFPVRTHVFPTAYYVQLATFIFAKPHGFLFRSKSKIHEYTSRINRTAKLVKFTLEGDRPNSERGGWPMMASVKLITGVAGGNYDPAALKNLLLLWFQDIAELIASPGNFELHAPMEESSDGR